MLRGPGFRRLVVVVLALAALGPTPAVAGWLGFRNDTRTTLIVQDVVLVHGQARRGAQRKLGAGELAVESVSGAGIKRLLILDPRQPTRPLLRVDVSYTGADQIFSIQIEPATMPGALPRCKLVPVPGKIGAKPGQPPKK